MRRGIPLVSDAAKLDHTEWDATREAIDREPLRGAGPRVSYSIHHATLAVFLFDANAKLPPAVGNFLKFAHWAIVS
jgi:hypothetical protein